MARTIAAGMELSGLKDSFLQKKEQAICKVLFSQPPVFDPATYGRCYMFFLKKHHPINRVTAVSS